MDSKISKMQTQLLSPLDALFFPGSVPLQKRVRYGTYCSYSMIAALEGH